jgi:hypothetical protein
MEHGAREFGVPDDRGYRLFFARHVAANGPAPAWTARKSKFFIKNIDKLNQ